MQIFDFLLVNPLINLLVVVYQALSYLNISGALGFSIIITTVIIKQILYPLTAIQLRTTKKMQEIQPLIAKLKNKYKNDPKRLQQEQMSIFKNHGINPVAGCLPLLVQGVLLMGFYFAIFKIIGLNTQETTTVVNEIVYLDLLKLKSAWDTGFFGLSLSETPSSLISSLGYLIVSIPLVTGLLQLVQAKMLMPASETATPLVGNLPQKTTEPDFARTLQTQMLYIMPVVIGVVSYQFALGLSLYWNTFTIFGIIQQYRLQGLGGLADWVKK